MLSNTEAELKKALLIKKACSQVMMASIVGHAYIYDKHMSCLKMKKIYAKEKLMQTYRIKTFIIKLIE